jgi:tetratricopeptide (TPR) repeat protein
VDRSGLYIVLMLLGFGLAAPGAVAAQETAPLTKTDVIRLLVSPSTTQTQAAETIRARCLSFQPTPADVTDFRRLGATQPVLDAIQACERQRQAEARRREQERQRPPTPPAQRPAQPEQRRPAAQLRLDVDSARIATGAEVEIPVHVDRSGQPVSGIQVVARGSGTLPGARGADVTAVTDQDGTARLRVTAPSTAGRFQIQIAATGSDVQGGGPFQLVVLAGPARTVLLQPDHLRLAREGLDTLSVSVVVHDAGGNGVSGAEVRVRKSETGGREVSWRSRTGPFGLADFRLPTDAFAGGDTLAVLVDGKVLGELPVTGERAPGVAVRPAAMQAQLDRAQGLLDGGQAAEAEQAFREIVNQDPRNAAALVGLGQALLAQGARDRAEARFREALGADPNQVDAMQGLARLAADRGDQAAAAEWLRSVAEHQPAEPDAWIRLGDQYLAAGEARLAHDAFQRALVLDPRSPEARRGLRRVESSVRSTAPYAEGFVWGGKVFGVGVGGNNGRPAGFRRGGLAVWPVPQLRLRGYYDNMLLLDHPDLVRGNVDMRGVWGDLLVSYGPGERFSTLAGYGRRGQPPYDVGEDVFELAQTVRLGEGLRDFDRVSLRLGGLIGHWYDRTDYLITTTIGVPASPTVRVLPSFSYGDYVGTVGFAQRYAAKEGRFTLGLDIRPAQGWDVRPALSYGDVTAQTDSLSGGLFDGTLQVRAPVGDYSAVQAFFRYQSAPGLPQFTTLGLGLVGLVPRP